MVRSLFLNGLSCSKWVRRRLAGWADTSGFFGEALWTLVFRGVAVLFDVAFAERLLVMCFWPALAALPGSVVLPLTFGWQSMIHIISGHVVECTCNQCSMGTTSCRLPWCSRELEVLSRWILIITRLQSVLPHWCHAGLHLICLDMQLFQQCSCVCCWRVHLCVFRLLSWVEMAGQTPHGQALQRQSEADQRILCLACLK